MVYRSESIRECGIVKTVAETLGSCIKHNRYSDIGICLCGELFKCDGSCYVESVVRS
jgi:hypothetical protein